MIGHSRFAIYWAPKAGRFADATSAWLGWDAISGRDVPHLAVDGLPRPASEITASPRTYGFHGTIKPPFRLSEGASAEDLDLALRSLCLAHPPLLPGDLSIARLGGFVALTPRGDEAGLRALAATVVRELDRFRAPATEAEIARRMPDRLTSRQKSNLLRWGYPYVMEDFRFHLTLTGELPLAETVQVERALSPILGPVLPHPFVIDSLCLFGQSKHDGRFRLLHRYPLKG